MVAQNELARQDLGPSTNGRLAGPGVKVTPGHDAQQETISPALLRPYWNLGTIRHDYPVVLLDGPDGAIAPLADLIDGLLRRIDPGTRDIEALRRQLYRLETHIKRLAEDEPGARLLALWARAAAALLKGVADEERRATLGQELEAAREALDLDGAVLPCRPDAARPIVEHAWRHLRAEQASEDAAALADLSGRISDLIDAERAQAPEALTPEALRASMAGERSGVDFEAFSRLLARAQHHTRPSGRVRRLGEPLRVLEGERERLTDESAALGRGGDGPPARAFQTCDAAIAASRADAVRRSRVLRAVRLGTLELESRSRGQRHDASFAGVDAGELSPEERRVLPPLLVELDADGLLDRDWAGLLRVLASEAPLKILLLVHRLPGVKPDSPNSGDWGTRIGETALLTSEAFIVQASVSQLPRMGPTLTASLRHQGPALIAVYVGPTDRAGSETRPTVPTFALCAAAVESRAFPSFVSDPGAGTAWSARFSLVGDPQPDAAFPRHQLRYEDGDGGSVAEDIPFTVIDLLALEPVLRRHFELVPRAEWSARMVPLAEQLGETSVSTGTLPFIYVVDASDRLHRAVVSPELVAVGRASAANWARLQALARAGAPTAAPPVETVPPPPAATVEEAPVQPPAAASGPAALAPAPEAATAPAAGVAYIESALCTTCDECTGRNPRMFAYNAQKQAFIQDLRAGTYRELVEAAENCPVCIIHTGQPLDPNEPGLEDLLKRAALFG